jgi:hypothetical protein
MELAIDDAKARAQAMAGQASSPYGKDMSAEKGPLSFGQEVGNMAKQRAMSGALDAGQAGITSALSSSAPVVASGVEGGAMLGAGAGAGGAGMMATAGAAMPYVGAALLADKALGLGITDSLFSSGGQVGPLSPQYHASGETIYPGSDTLRSYIGRNPESIGALKTEYDVRNKAQQEDLAKQKRLMAESYEDLTPFKTINNILHDFGNPYGSESERQSAYNKGFAKNYGDLFNQYRDAKGFNQGGEVMSREQAMALMNNQPDPRELMNEIKQEMSMTEGAIGTPQAMPAPLARPVDPLQQYRLEGRDRTYNPYDMIRPDNTPNT